MFGNPPEIRAAQHPSPLRQHLACQHRQLTEIFLHPKHLALFIAGKRRWIDHDPIKLPPLLRKSPKPVKRVALAEMLRRVIESVVPEIPFRPLQVRERKGPAWSSPHPLSLPPPRTRRCRKTGSEASRLQPSAASPPPGSAADPEKSPGNTRSRTKPRTPTRSHGSKTTVAAPSRRWPWSLRLAADPPHPRTNAPDFPARAGPAVSSKPLSRSPSANPSPHRKFPLPESSPSTVPHILPTRTPAPRRPPRPPGGPHPSHPRAIQPASPQPYPAISRSRKNPARISHPLESKKLRHSGKWDRNRASSRPRSSLRRHPDRHSTRSDQADLQDGSGRANWRDRRHHQPLWSTQPCLPPDSTDEFRTNGTSSADIRM